MKTVKQLFRVERLMINPWKSIGIISICLIFIMGLSACNGENKQHIISVESDTQPPAADMTEPSNIAAAPVDTAIIIDLRDSGSGVNPNKIKFIMDGAEIEPDIDADNMDYRLTYKSRVNYGYMQTVDVTVEAEDHSGNFMSQSFGFVTEPFNGNPFDDDLDTDNDGISDYIEDEILSTNKDLKTLFVKPSMKGNSVKDEYWEEFAELLPLAPFVEAEIEIVVIGDPNNPYEPMAIYNFDPTDFKDPETNIAIPCDILEIRYMGENTYCAEHGSQSKGHTYFKKTEKTWYWDTKGYTPCDTFSDSNFDKYQYYKAKIYPFPLNNYLTEGAYPSIARGMKAIEVLGCVNGLCYEYQHCSPLNLNDDDISLPANQEGNGDIHNMTVEFNPINFDEFGEIQNVGPPSPVKYKRKQILARTLVHEMGHALLTAQGGPLSCDTPDCLGDHCANPECIMYGGVLDWEINNFGSGTGDTTNCPHKAGGAQDIRARVHNRIHTNLPEP